MNRRTLVKRVGAGAAGGLTATGLASATEDPVVFEELTVDGQQLYVRAGAADRAELSADSACDCPLCPRCLNCDCESIETLRATFDRPVVVR